MTTSDIGDLGPAEASPVTYYWNPIYNFMGVIPWLLLVLAFILFRENRKPQALWIVLPLILLRLIWAGFSAIASIPSEAAAVFIFMIDCLLIGFALNWLLADRIGNRNRFITWLLSVMIFAAVFAATLVNIGLGSEALQVSIFIGMTVAILSISFPAAVFLCRKKCGAIQFSVWTAVWIILMTSLFFTGIVMIQSAISGFSVMQVLPQVIVVMLVYAGILIVALLPFEILWFNNSFWRKRFEALFGIKTRRPVEVPVEVPAAEIPTE